MDLESAIRTHPHLGIPFVLCVLLSVSLLSAFLMQWNQYSMLEKKWSGLREEWKRGARARTLLRWYFFGDVLAAKRIWGENRGIRFIFPLGLAFGIGSWLLYLALKRAAGL